MQNLSDTERSQVLSVVNDSGQSLDDLWNTCKIFSEKTDLARALNSCVGSKLLFKHGNLYFTSYKHEATSKVAPKRVRKPKPAQAVSRMGDLIPGTDAGKVAIALHLNRERHLSSAEIQDILIDDVRVSSVLKLLLSRGYIYLRHTAGPDTYKWTDTFDYPFAHKLGTDAHCLKF